MTTPPGFEADIKPLFRQRDRSAMLFMFDLWDQADVAANVADILAALEGGEMPCDGAWPPERVELLRQWAQGGTRP